MMRRKSFAKMQCPVARGLERVGEWWSILILRDAFAGLTRFDEFQKSLGIAPNILTRRLQALVASGLMERRCYETRPARYDYVLTPRGVDFRPVLLLLQTWGNRHFAPEGASVVLVDASTGVPAEPVLVDLVTGQPITASTHRNVAGPAATARVKRRLATSARAGTSGRDAVSPPRSSPKSRRSRRGTAGAQP